jgi:hypothetical protein
MSDDALPKPEGESVAGLDAGDPVRLTDPGSDAPPELVAALRAGRSQRGTDAQMRALRERLGLQFAASRVPGGAAAKLLRFKLLLGGLLLVGGLAFGYLA